MNFLYPAFLFGLLSLSIPVIIHLFNFRRFKTIYFTNVRFLKNIQEETATKNKLKHLLVLISRCLALAFLVFAFAQPYIPSENSENRSMRRAVGIYIDNSFSMESVIDDEQMVNIAKRKAEEIVNGYTIDEKFQLLTNQFEAKHQRILSKDEMLQMIAAVQITPDVKPMQEIFSRQKDILNREEGDVQKIVYEISDFQKNTGFIENDSTVQVNMVLMESSSKRNVTIDSAWFITPVQMLNQQSQLCIRVKNYGGDDINNAPVTLKLNDQIKSLTDVSISSNSEIIDTLSFTVTEPGWYTGELSIKDYPVTFDDVLYFSFKPVSKISVLSINGVKENSFIQSFYGGNPLFALKNNAASQIDFNQLDTYDLIILNEVKNISGGLSQALTDLLNKGGNVLIWPALDMDVNSMNQFLQNNRTATYGNLIRSRRNVTEINSRMSLLKDVFEKIPDNLSMPYADISYEINSFSRTLEEPIMSFSDKKPMMAKFPVNEGIIYLSSVPLDRSVTDLAVQGSLFAPLMYKIAINTQKKSPLYATIGETKWIEIKDIRLSGDQTLKVKSDINEFIPEIRKSGNITEINISAYTNIAGIYSVSSDESNQISNAQTLALNYNRTESELAFFTKNDLEEKYKSQNVNIFDDVDRNFSNIVTQFNEGTPLWKFCIIFVLIFLAAEIALIRLLP